MFPVVLFTNTNSIYKQMGLETYDQARDARTFAGQQRIIAHPPCRLFSNNMRHYSKADRREKELAMFAIEILLKNGGCLEHPRNSKLFDWFNLPKPGETKGGLKTIEIHQQWFGYPTLKRTWILMSDYLKIPELPFSLLPKVNNRRLFENMSKSERSATTPQLAEWLIKLSLS